MEEERGGEKGDNEELMKEVLEEREKRLLEEEEDSNWTRLLQLLDAEDQILFDKKMVTNCAVVMGMECRNALFMFCTNNFYLVVDYNIDEEKMEIFAVPHSTFSYTTIFNSKPAPPLPAFDSNEEKKGEEEEKEMKGKRSKDLERVLMGYDCKRWSYEDLSEVLSRTYLLQKRAMEVFSSDGRNLFLVFPSDKKAAEIKKLLSQKRGKKQPGKQDEMMLVSTGMAAHSRRASAMPPNTSTLALLSNNPSPSPNNTNNLPPRPVTLLRQLLFSKSNVEIMQSGWINGDVCSQKKEKETSV